MSAVYGIDFVFLNTPIFQIGSAEDEIYLDNEMDLYVQCRVFENEATSGRIFAWGLWVQTFTDLPSGTFAKSNGLFTLPNGGATDPDKSVVAPSALWWEQSFEPLGLTYRAGQLYAASLWGSGDTDTAGMRSATIWTSAHDLSNLVMYYHTQHNRQVRMIDVNRIDFGKINDILTLPLDEQKSQAIKDRTPQM